MLIYDYELPTNDEVNELFRETCYRRTIYDHGLLESYNNGGYQYLLLPEDLDAFFCLGGHGDSILYLCYPKTQQIIPFDESGHDNEERFYWFGVKRPTVKEDTVSDFIY